MSLKPLIPTAAILGAIYLMATGKDGWGWLLFIAVILA